MNLAPTAMKAAAIPMNPASLNKGGLETTLPAAPFEVAELAVPEEVELALWVALGLAVEL